MPFTDPVLIFATVMVLILLSPIAARRLRLPEIVGLILAGMIFGDHGVGILARDDTMKLLGQVGLLFIMFLAGLEIDLHQVRRQRSHSVVFGLSTFIIPLVLGTVLGLWVLGMQFPTALLMASMFSSHTLLTFPAAGRLGLTKSRAATTTIGGTIITDTLALLTLAVIAAGTKGDLNATFWILLTVKLTVYLVGMLLLAPRIGRWFLRRFSADENLDFIAVLAIAFTASYLAHLSGLEPIIGAFLAGLMLNSLIPEKGALMGKIHFVGNALFIPFFLLSVGMLVNVELLWQGAEAWLIIGVMVPVALFSKWLAAFLFGKIMRYEQSEVGLIYGLSVNQAAATLAAALVGYDIGLFNDGVITGTIAMIAITCFIGPMVTEKYGRRLAARARQSAIATAIAPHRVMLPVHSIAKDKEILDLAFFLRSAHSHEPLYPVNVVYEGPEVEVDIAQSEKLLDHLVMRALAVDVPITPLVVVETNVAAGILRAAREKRISIISMIWDGEVHARPKKFGHTIDRVIENTTQLVLVNRLRQPLATTGRILLVCPPFSNLLPGFNESLSAVKTIAQQSGSKLVLLLPNDSIEPFRKAVESSKATVPTEYLSYAVWKQITVQISESIQLDDWIIVLTARIGQIAWQPSSDRLPRNLVTLLPEHNLSFIHPAAEIPTEQQSVEVPVEDSLVSQILQPDHCLFGADTSDVRALLEQVMTPVFEARGGTANRIVDSLTAIARIEPVELVPELILLHEHRPEVEGSEIFLVTSTEPMDVPQVEHPTWVALILLDPAEQTPAEHLTALGRIAKLIKLPGFVEKTRNASSYEELITSVGAITETPPDSGKQ